MCSILDFYSNSPDGVKMLIMALPWLTLLAVTWLWTRRKPVVRVEPLTEAQLRAIARDMAIFLRHGDYWANGEQDDTTQPPWLNPPEDREE